MAGRKEKRMLQKFKKCSISKIMFSAFYMAIALCAIIGENLLDKFYFICLTVCIVRLFLLDKKKEKAVFLKK
ncbi:MAG TPA: hypothetical protein IAC24_05945 [Candidatus Onthousia faecigallinarum]|nr:hypothetical protein [Candidatus Onthousia faecigallinarum]